MPEAVLRAPSQQAVDTDEIRETTTVILAGYPDEIENLLSYNVGFASRFPLEFRSVRCSVTDITNAE